jgi:methyl-accepting chemotaxis protein
MPSGEPHLQREMATFSSPIDKLFIVIDEFVALQREVENLKYENEDLQLNFESYAREIEQLREVSKNSDLSNKELESKSSELLEVTVNMERMIQRLGHLGGKDVPEDSRPTTTHALVSKLEKLIIASSTEAGNTKSTIQEMGAKLQSREKVVDELSTKVKMLEDLYHAHAVQPETSKDRAFEASSSAIGSDMSEIEDLVRLYSVITFPSSRFIFY